MAKGHTRIIRGWRPVVAAGPIVLAVATLSSFTPADAKELRGHFLGGANGVETNATVGPVKAGLNRAAYNSCGCGGTNGKIRTNTVDSLKAGDDGDVAAFGKMKATVYTDRSATAAVVKTIAQIDSVDLLDGLITADAITARAKFKARSRRMSHSLSQSKFVNLEIAGTPVDPDVPNNTAFDLPGIGTVTLKSVKKTGNYSHAGKIRLDMIRIHVEQSNSLGLPVGSVIVVGRASAGYSRTPVTDMIGGAAYLATANGKAGEDAQNAVGRPGLLHVGCEGTGGETKTEKFVGLGDNAILESGAGKSTAKGGPTDTGASVKMTSEVADISLLGGLITLEGVRAVSRDSIRNGQRKSSSRGTKVVGLTVAGQSLGTIRAKNVEILVPSVGTLYVNEVFDPPAGSRKLHRVNGLRLKADSPSIVLPSGGQLVIAHAQSTAY